MQTPSVRWGLSWSTMITTSCSPLTALEPSCRPPTSSATASRSTATRTTRRWQGCRASCRRTGAASHQEATDVTWVATNDRQAATQGWSSFLETAGCAGCQQAVVADGTEARLPGGQLILVYQHAPHYPVLQTRAVHRGTVRSHAVCAHRQPSYAGLRGHQLLCSYHTEHVGLQMKQAGSLSLTADRLPICRLRVSPPPLPSIGCCSS